MPRTTIDLDDDLRARLQNLVPARGMNRFINEAVAEKLALREQQELDQAMKEGYLATAEARMALNQDWEVLDVRDWPT